MKRVLFLFVLMGLCWTAFTKDLMQGDEFSVSMELEFRSDPSAFISWNLVGDDWDLFDYSFSQGSINGKIYTIKASEYKDLVDGKDGITLTVKGKPKTKAGNYNLKMQVANVSDGLGFTKKDLELSLDINYILPPPVPIWKRLLVPGIILLALVALILLVLNLTSKFPKGLLQVGREEISLKGKKEISLQKELSNLGIALEDGVDVIFDKKRFGAFQGPRIKKMHNCLLEREGMFLSIGSIILPDEDVTGLVDINGNQLPIHFC